MTTSPQTLLLALTLAMACAAAPAFAEGIQISPRYQVGDGYVLSLGLTTDTSILSRSRDRDSYREQVRLGYTAAVEVLEVDASGTPVHERHRNVQLTFERPEETGSLFREGKTLEVVRTAEAFEVMHDGQRIDARVEDVVESLLGRRFAHSLERALVDPGRAVKVNESWILDPERATRLLHERGVRVLEFGEPALARLERAEDDPEGELRVAYRIPVAWAELAEMPLNTSTGETGAVLEGVIRLSPHGRGAPTQVTSNLRLRMHGIARGVGPAQVAGWQLQWAERADQHIVALTAAHDGYAALPPAPAP